MARFRRNVWKDVVALVAAALFILQSLAAARAEHPVLLDIFGNPICVTGIDGADHSVPQPGGHADQNCCMLGCAATGTALATAPAAFAAVSRHESAIVHVPVDGIVVPAPGHRPGSPRAPPLVA